MTTVDNSIMVDNELSDFYEELYGRPLAEGVCMIQRSSTPFASCTGRFESRGRVNVAWSCKPLVGKKVTSGIPASIRGTKYGTTSLLLPPIKGRARTSFGI